MTYNSFEMTSNVEQHANLALQGGTRSFNNILKDHYSLKTGGLSAGMTHLCTKYKIECRTIYGLTKFIPNYLPGLLFNFSL